ncbi:MAG: hypothetical protein R3F33_14920 [Planctomycetota bacterium]
MHPPLIPIRAVALLAFLPACGSGPQPAPQDTVLSKGEGIRVTNGNGTVEVHWSGMAQRRFEFHGKRKTEDMTVRTSPWYGCMGIYSAGGREWPLMGRFMGGAFRVIYEESARDFPSELAWQEWAGGHWNQNEQKLVWNDRGTVAGFFTTPDDPSHIAVDLYQVTIAGQPSDWFSNHPCEGGSIEMIQVVD